jgi:uncharacterized protein
VPSACFVVVPAIFAGRGPLRCGLYACGRMTLTLDVLPQTLAIARLPASATIPAWAAGEPLTSVTRTADELSIVCVQSAVPDDVPQTGGYRALAVRGPLDFGLTGILSGLTAPLAAAGVPVFVLSTYDTDLVLVPEAHVDAAVAALRAAGCAIQIPGR